MKAVRIIMLTTIICFAFNAAEAKTYLENFNKIGGVIEVSPSSPFPRGWKNSGNLWANDDSAWESPWSDYSAGIGQQFSQSDIDAVKALDGVYSRSSTTASDTLLGDDAEYAVMEFMFSVATSSTHLEINAYLRDEDDGIQAYIWNFETCSWEMYANYSDVNLGWTWINFTTDSPSSYISSSGKVYVLFQSQAYARLWGSDTANIDVDYIEARATVPDASVQTACVSVIPGSVTGISRDWDGIFDDDTIGVRIQVTSGGNPVGNYPAYIRGEWDNGYGAFGIALTNSSGYATLSGEPISGGVSDKWRVTFKAAISDVMVNGKAYEVGAGCGEETFARDVAVTPGSYNITLIGRYWDVGGGDWVKVRWIAEPEDVDPVNVNGYSIPAAQHFHHWDLLIWKMGIVDPNNDDNSQTEGINGNTNDVDAETQPACIGPDEGAYCGKYICQADGECCYLDNEGAHNCGEHLSGYRFGPFIQFNAPDHVLGVVISRTIEMCTQYSTIPDIMRQPYSRIEGPDALPCTVHIISLDYTINTVSSEEAFRNGYRIIGIVNIFDPDPHSGLGLPGFIGLAADNEHVVGILLGHRYGIHPFVALVTSMPAGSYPGDHDIPAWQNFYPTWIYYLLRNLAYNIKVMAEELLNWDKRYPEPDHLPNPTNEDNIVFANIALNRFIIDFLPYLKQTLWVMEVSGNNTINTFIIATYTQFYDSARIIKQIVMNSTLRSELENVTGILVTNMASITGPPDGRTGLNYLLKFRVLMPYSEKERADFEVMKLLDQMLSVIIKLLKNLPGMEHPQDYPWWGYGNFISNS
ncbi:hypothetical protein [Archaeoglobus neptunius]|uniref:hypothetical protein n=1 Tax=Archaeoglobus neptunius TaxID=2798580 RepID=UPI001929432F|nr:hypothetical protein [Archaeoglobus neptunius]